MPALLAENLFPGVDIGSKDRIHIHVHKVLEVPVVAACHGIYGLVRIGHGVEEGVQRTLCQLYEGILCGKKLGAAEHRMLHDMGNSGGIRRRRPEAYVKHLVFIIVLKEEDPGAGSFVAQQIAVAVKFFNLSFFYELVFV